jgi:hypothetical protein
VERTRELAIEAMNEAVAAVNRIDHDTSILQGLARQVLSRTF